MKKCYTTPTTENVIICLSSLLQNSGGEIKDSVNGAKDKDGKDLLISGGDLGDNDEIGARQRGGDFGSLW